MGISSGQRANISGYLVGEGVAAASSEPDGQGTSAECKGQRTGSSLEQEDQSEST